MHGVQLGSPNCLVNNSLCVFKQAHFYPSKKPKITKSRASPGSQL
ncbi:hypothetical protein FD23_GL000319 [Lactobacillus delbrueckii subsp. delbrueckii DSM 20074 = JCM 1012]|nr:hypothetical protein FD23_GL000319 [Lactobacillus delbrueckii subsp. delbrueckii DSM 20074 = JCM 1012]